LQAPIEGDRAVEICYWIGNVTTRAAMSIRQFIISLLLLVPPVRRYVEAKRALAVRLELAESEHRRLCGEVASQQNQLEQLRATLGEANAHAATLEAERNQLQTEGERLRTEREQLRTECEQLQNDIVIRNRVARRNIEQDVDVLAQRIGRYKLDPSLARKDIVLTVAAGRSGTRLLAVLLSKVLGVNAQHEPEPRANFWVRSTLENPVNGIDWLIEEKLPAIAAHPQRLYVETSHFFCKGLIEPMLMLGLRPRFVVLRRSTSEVARSFYMLNVIPARNAEGRLNLTYPSDANSLSLPDWEGYSDYQLCYWYAKDMERRQTAYLGYFIRNSIPHIEIDMNDLLDWDSFLKVCRFVDPSAAGRELSQSLFSEIVATNQNTRDMAHPVGHVDRALPADAAQQERQIDLACASKDVSSALNLELPRLSESEGALK